MNLKRGAGASLLSLACAGSGWAAGANTGAISGTITDAHGGVVTGASVSLHQLELGLERRVATRHDGRYEFAGLPLGRYQVRVDGDGFARETRTGVRLSVGQDAVVDFRLQIRGLRDEVLVEAEGAGPGSTGSVRSSLVDDATVRQLPLNGRDLGQLILLQPGVVWARSSTQSAVTGRGTRLSVSGARPDQNLFVLDGTVTNDALNHTPGSAQGLLLGVDTVQEFRVLTHGFAAEYGRAAGGVVTAVTRSGANALHGSLFGFHRDDALDARNYFARGTPEFRRNQVGATLGGPIQRDRTFFFVGYERLREFKQVPNVAIVPDDDARSGRLPTGNVGVDPRSLGVLDLFPRANGRRLGDGTAEFIGSTDRDSEADQLTIRLDRAFASGDSVFVRYQFERSSLVLPRNFPEFPNLFEDEKHVASAELRKLLSPRLLSVTHLAFHSSRPQETAAASARSFELLTGRGLGEIAVGGLSEIGTDRSNPRISALDDYQFSQQFSLHAGRHRLKAGLQLERLHYDAISESRTRGQLRFRSLPDLLAFRVQDLQAAAAGSDYERNFRQWLVGGYLQDEMRVTPRLTLDLGLRYEVVSELDEKYDRIANLREVMDPVVSVGEPLFEPPKRNLAPRLGFRFDASGAGSTIVAGGFGVFHEPPLYFLFRNAVFRSPPFVNRGRLTGSQVASLPVDPARFLGVERTTESTQTDLRSTYNLHYHVGVQRRLPAGLLGSVDYVGSRGVNQFGLADANTALGEVLPDGRTFFAEGSRRRNPNFDAVTRTYQGFTSRYNGLHMTLSRPWSHALAFQATYALAKAIDDAPGSGRLSWSNGQLRTLDPYDRSLDRSRSNTDVRHTLSAAANWALPFHVDGGGVRAALVNGWHVHAAATLYSGLPFTAMVSGDPDRDATDENSARPDSVPGQSLVPVGGPTPELWFNPEAFAPPALGFRGTTGRNVLTGPDYRTLDIALAKHVALGHARLEFRLEAFNVTNRANFDLPSNADGGEMVFLYTPAAGGRPARFDVPASAGRIFSTAGEAREIQVGARLAF